MTSIDERAKREAESDVPQLLGLDEFVLPMKACWLVHQLLPAESIVVLFGAPKSGKTQTVVDMTMHAAHGMHWHGYNVSRPLRIAYFAGEGRSGLRVRLHAWRQHHAAQLHGDMRVMPHALSLVTRLPDLLTMLRPYKPDVVVVDTLNAYFGAADENSTQDMTAFVAAIRFLRDELNCCVLVIHHTGLADTRRERGSSVLRAAADVIVQVARDEAGSGLVGLQVVEARDMDAWSEPLSLQLVQVETDWKDDDGRPISSCLVTSGHAPVTLPGRGRRALTKVQTTVLTIARELAAQRCNGLAEVLLPRHEISARAEQRGQDRRRVSEAWRALARRDLIRLVEPGSVMVRVNP